MLTGNLSAILENTYQSISQLAFHVLHLYPCVMEVLPVTFDLFHQLFIPLHQLISTMFVSVHLTLQLLDLQLPPGKSRS